MRIIEYDVGKRLNKKIIKGLKPLVERAVRNVKSKHNFCSGHDLNLNRKLKVLSRRYIPYLSEVSPVNFRSARVLDLGCGSYPALDGASFGIRHFEPWLCRILFYMGIGVTGVDLGELDNEYFRSYGRTDLMKFEDSPAYTEIEDNSIHVANVRSVFDSPFLVMQYGFDHGLKDYLIKTIERKMTKNGVLFLGPNLKDYERFLK